MRRVMLLTVAVTLIAAPLPTAPVGERAADGDERGATELLVAAASSLRFAFEELGNEFETRTGVPVTFSFGSSGMLAQQIENGAPFDLFFSADRAYVEQIIDAGLGSGPPQLYAVGYLALVVPSDAEVPTVDELLHPRFESIAIANPAHAPYGLGARRALEELGYYRTIEERLVYGDNVLDAMRMVETGNADAGIIALAFLAAADGLTGRKVEPGLHPPIEQSAVIIDGSAHPEAAEEFLGLVFEETGREILRRFRFGVRE